MEGIEFPILPRNPTLFAQFLTTFLPAFLAGLGIFSIFSVPVLAAWKIGLENILHTQAWFPPLAFEFLAGFVVAVSVYFATYMIIWSMKVLSQRESKVLSLQQNNPSAPPLLLEFNAVALSDTQWSLYARLEHPNWPYSVEVKGKPSDRIIWTSTECKLDANTSRGEISARLTRAFNWRVFLCPWPDRWLVPLEIAWSRNSIPIVFHIIIDAPEAFPKLLMAPLRWLLSAFTKITESKPAK